MKKIAITGASGFVGSSLSNMFKSLGMEVLPIKRELLSDVDKLSSFIDGCDAIINLAGANIINRWSESYKKLLYSSRIDTTKNLVEAMKRLETKPSVFISTSAVGIYSNQKQYTEKTIEYADDFLGNLCKDWEDEALKAQEEGIRTVIYRFGIVLGHGGALQKMLLPFKLGFGGIIGDGKQAFSYIHMEDLKDAFRFAIDNENTQGAYNLTAPEPTTNYGLTKALGAKLNRPTVLPVPAFVLNIIFSEGAKVLTDGQSVVPARLLEEGFKFRFSTIEDTINNLV